MRFFADSSSRRGCCKDSEDVRPGVAETRASRKVNFVAAPAANTPNAMSGLRRRETSTRNSACEGVVHSIHCNARATIRGTAIGDRRLGPPSRNNTASNLEVDGQLAARLQMEEDEAMAALLTVQDMALPGGEESVSVRTSDDIEPLLRLGGVELKEEEWWQLPQKWRNRLSGPATRRGADRSGRTAQGTVRANRDIQSDNYQWQEPPQHIWEEIFATGLDSPAVDGSTNYEDLTALADRVGPATEAGASEFELDRLPSFDIRLVSPLDGHLFDDNDVLCTTTAHRFVRRGTCCSICLEEYVSNQSVSVLNVCGHMFHSGCVKAWLRNRKTCPIDRQCVNF